MEILCRALGTLFGIVLFSGAMYLILLFSLWNMQRDIRKKSGNKNWSIWKIIAKNEEVR
jgi:hypothetical protein